MTNFEKYKDEILEIVEHNDIASIAIDIKKNKPQYCSGTCCSQCIRYGDDGRCSSQVLFKWLYEEAKENLCLPYGGRGMKPKPCPNCGSNRVYIWHICTAWLPWWHYAECEDCHWCGKTKLFRRRAIRAWNKEVEQ